MEKVKVTRGGEPREERSRYSSLFWPIVLIGIGAIWLLGNLGILSFENILILARLWPLVLIVIGLDMLFGRHSPALGALIGVGTIVVLLALMLVGPALGLGYDVEIVNLANSEPAGDAQSAQIIVKAGTGEVNITPLSDSPNLIDFDIQSIGQVNYQVDTSGTQKIIRLEQDEVSGFDGFASFLASIFEKDENNLHWDVRLSPETPLDLRVTSGTGALTLNLGALQVTRLNAAVGTGSLNLTLPASDASYPVDVSTGTGSGNVTIMEGAALEMRVNSGTGSFTIDVPDNAAVRFIARTGTGSINMPAFLQRVGGKDENSFVGDNGTWETDNFANADEQIVINYEGGTGSLNVR